MTKGISYVRLGRHKSNLNVSTSRTADNKPCKTQPLHRDGRTRESEAVQPTVRGPAKRRLELDKAMMNPFTKKLKEQDAQLKCEKMREAETLPTTNTTRRRTSRTPGVPHPRPWPSLVDTRNQPPRQHSAATARKKKGNGGKKPRRRQQHADPTKAKADNTHKTGAANTRNPQRSESHKVGASRASHPEQRGSRSYQQKIKKTKRKFKKQDKHNPKPHKNKHNQKTTKPGRTHATKQSGHTPITTAGEQPPPTGTNTRTEKPAGEHTPKNPELTHAPQIETPTPPTHASP